VFAETVAGGGGLVLVMLGLVVPVEAKTGNPWGSGLGVVAPLHKEYIGRSAMSCDLGPNAV
jgi:hypothetical protein